MNTLIEHSKQLNDFVSFYIETKINGVLSYETAIDYFQYQYTILNVTTKIEATYSFDKDKDEQLLEVEIKRNVEELIGSSNQLNPIS